MSQWFDAERRGYRVVWKIRQALLGFGLKTEPDFESAYIGGVLSFTRDGSESEVSAPEPTYRIGMLEAANRKPVCVTPDNSLKKAITVMLCEDFSQLPVMTGVRDVQGIISWKSIGTRLWWGGESSLVTNCMSPPQIVESEVSIFSVIDRISEHDYVLVRDREKVITGIVTSTDLSQQFRQLAEPFLRVGEIENLVRRLIHGKFEVEELQQVVDSSEGRLVEGVADLTFGEYKRLLEKLDNWERLSIPVDRLEVVNKLEKVRILRNDVMHFDPDGLSDPDIKTLRDFACFLQTLNDLD